MEGGREGRREGNRYGIKELTPLGLGVQGGMAAIVHVSLMNVPIVRIRTSGSFQAACWSRRVGCSCRVFIRYYKMPPQYKYSAYPNIYNIIT